MQNNLVSLNRYRHEALFFFFNTTVKLVALHLSLKIATFIVKFRILFENCRPIEDWETIGSQKKF
jgi:hypothetical protein